MLGSSRITRDTAAKLPTLTHPSYQPPTVPGALTLAELARLFDIHPNLLIQWKAQLLDGAAGVFGSEGDGELTALHTEIEALTLENDLLSRRARESGVAERKAMFDRSHALPITKQAKVLNVSRSSMYYQPRPTSADDLELMRRMKELHLNLPLAGSRTLRDLLKAEGFEIGRKHVITLMKRIRI